MMAILVYVGKEKRQDDNPAFFIVLDASYFSTLTLWAMFAPLTMLKEM